MVNPPIENAQPVKPVKPEEENFIEASCNPPASGSIIRDDTALGEELQAIAAQLNQIAGEMGQPPTVVFEAQAFATPRETIDDLTTRLREALKAVGEQVKTLAENVATLEVRTYASEDLDSITWKDGKINGKVTPCALTFIAMDGDTQMVVPTNAGQVNQVLWEAHSRAVEQAQANRLAALKALADLLAGLLPNGK